MSVQPLVSISAPHPRGVAQLALWLLALVLLLVLASSVAFGQIPAVGQIYQKVAVDFDGDGQPETVGLRVTRHTDAGWDAQLVVLNKNGTVRWQGPTKAAQADPLSFGGWDWGVTELQAGGDIDGNGTAEIIVSEPQSDVRAPRFRVLRWTGGTFERVRTMSLVQKKRGTFSWVNDEGLGKGTWIGKFISPSGKGWIAEVWVSDGSRGRIGRALVMPTSGGFRVAKWVSAPK